MNSSLCLRDPIITSTFFWTMHVTIVVSLPINAVGLYCVAFKSPSYMNRYKWCVVHHMFWIMMLDIHITTLIIPDFLFPLPAAHLMGLLIKILPVKIVAFCGISSAGALIATLLHQFIYRHQAILPEYHRRHLSPLVRNILLGLIYIYFVTFSIPVLFMIPDDQPTAKALIAKDNCAPMELFLDVTFIASAGNSLFIYIYMLIFVFVGATIGSVFMLDAFNVLNSAMSHLSKQVKQLHDSALRVLIIQVAVPALLLAAPMTVLLVGSVLNYASQVLTCAVMQIVAFHGTVATIVMILINPAYRRFILQQPEAGKSIKMTTVTITRVKDELRRF